MHFPGTTLKASLILTSALSVTARVVKPRSDQQCRQTTVAILGAGVSGITAAQALANQSISDFLIVEANDYIGGRAKHTTFGKKADGSPYTVELGANWVQGLGTEGGPENPVWTFAKKWNITNTYSNYSSILTYNETGFSDYSDLLDKYDEASTILEQNAGYILTENLQDISARAGLSLAGWKPKKDPAAQATEWWDWDFESAYSPDQSGLLYGIANSNATWYQFSDEDNFVWDQRGFNHWIIGESSTFLKKNDSRLLLNTKVEKIDYSSDGVTITNADGSCISADYAITTFSLGVLQNEVVEFSPELPKWKKLAIETFDMGTYTKIFFQFNETFWPTDTQYFLYADPDRRGYYPIWQSLSTPGFLPGSNIIFVTVVDDESYRVEAQTDEQTKAEALEVLRKMFPDVDVPEPIDFMYPRWSLEPWVHGSYSNWPVGVTLEMHQNLRANIDRLWFASEANSAEYYGFLHGAWFEGRDVGERVASLVTGDCVNANADGNSTGACGDMVKYEILKGTTTDEAYDIANGWMASTFLTYGYD
ncbi:putative flavin-containing polyamine oxidase [Phyllosticta capitalensis]